MSRLGKIPIPVPSGVTVELAADQAKAKGPKGELTQSYVDGVSVSLEEGSIHVARNSDSRADRAAQGLMRRLLANMVEGVHAGFSRTLEITGVGYRADAKGSEIRLSLGFSHPIVYQLPDSVSVAIDKQTVITLNGPDRQVIGEVAANIRKLRPPEPYKGKGIRYSDETIRRKAGKAGA